MNKIIFFFDKINFTNFIFFIFFVFLSVIFSKIIKFAFDNSLDCGFTEKLIFESKAV